MSCQEISLARSSKMRAALVRDPACARWAFAIALLALLIPLGAGATGAGATLVVDTTFTIVTADPQRSFDATASLVERPVYDTLLTYGAGSSDTPVPLLADSYTSADGGRTWTFQLRHDARFADGTPLTSADVAFTFRRLINLHGRPSFLLRGDSVSAPGRYTVVIHSPTPVVAMPQIVASTSLGVLNEKLARLHGATDARDAWKTDSAEDWLNSSASAGVGSGPYILESYDPTTQVTLAPNEHYWGADKPKWGSVVVRNVIAASQLLDVQRGTHEVAIDLSLAQARSRPDPRLRVSVSPSPWVFLLFTNESPTVSEVTSNRHFQQAVRYGLDYKSLVAVAGPGTIQAPGVIPSSILGALPQKDRVHTNTEKAVAELRASGLGSPTVALEYPSDVTQNGVPFSTIAQKVQANLAPIGIHVQLDGVTTSIWLQDYVSNRMAFGLASRQVDYPDPLDFLAFMPGELVGAHVGWKAGADPTIEALAATARRTLATDARAEIFRRVQIELNRDGPFFPLIQPTQVFAATRDIVGARFNFVYQLDITRTAPR